MDIVITQEFRRNYKRLPGKYASLRDDLLALQAQLRDNPFLGADQIPLGSLWGPLAAEDRLRGKDTAIQ